MPDTNILCSSQDERPRFSDPQIVFCHTPCVKSEGRRRRSPGSLDDLERRGACVAECLVQSARINAFTESGIGTIKNELEMTEYNTIREALKEIAEYIRYYNFQHKHSAIEYLTPAQFEQLTQRSK